MKEMEKISIDLGSQDLTLNHMERFRKTVLDGAGSKKSFQELIMFSSDAKPYQYSSLMDFKEDLGLIPDSTGYFYYTISFSRGDRCALYLDPDRPARIVIQGEDDFLSKMNPIIEKGFPKGSSRYKAHSGWGYLTIWATVVIIAGSIIAAYSLLSEPNPYLIVWVLFVSSVLGIYLSVAKGKEINPANTMALGNKRKHPYVDMILHMLTITLGIVSVILVILFIEFNI